ncbi:MAG TPA: SoxY-related AACIE arm protein [Burkholderiales bacterium]|nr:SoxY-related AACIE arm protein [Burkholderiales bacterium]
MITRRGFLLLGLTSTSALAQLPPNIEAVRKAAFEEAIRKVVGNAEVRQGRVKLDVPPLIDNGNTVPLSVEVESPMTAADHAKAIHVFTERNPQPYVLTAHLGPRSGRARVSTRARIADTGTVTAIAQMSDGSFWAHSVRVVVTLSACLEEGLI